jgi:hypothetical protein
MKRSGSGLGAYRLHGQPRDLWTRHHEPFAATTARVQSVTMFGISERFRWIGFALAVLVLTRILNVWLPYPYGYIPLAIFFLVSLASSILSRRFGVLAKRVRPRDSAPSDMSQMRVAGLPSDSSAPRHSTNVLDEISRLAKQESLQQGRSTSPVWPVLALALMSLFLIGSAIALIRDATTNQPRTYRQLRSHGVGLTAQFAGCPNRLDCRLTLSYGGRSRTWKYGADYPQFDHLSVGAPVQVLLDPAHPNTVYTVHDVQTNNNTGRGLASVGLGLIVFGLLVLLLTFNMVRKSRRDSRKMERLFTELEQSLPFSAR